jgi:hypothetical protein
VRYREGQWLTRKRDGVHFRVKRGYSPPSQFLVVPISVGSADEGRDYVKLRPPKTGIMDVVDRLSAWDEASLRGVLAGRQLGQRYFDGWIGLGRGTTPMEARQRVVGEKAKAKAERLDGFGDFWRRESLIPWFEEARSKGFEPSGDLSVRLDRVEEAAKRVASRRGLRWVEPRRTFFVKTGSIVHPIGQFTGGMTDLERDEIFIDPAVAESQSGIEKIYAHELGHVIGKHNMGRASEWDAEEFANEVLAELGSF